jgi:hypothetical protein
MNNELERIWKEAVMTWFKVISQHLPGGTEEATNNLSRGRWFPVRDLNPRPPEYEACVNQSAVMSGGEKKKPPTEIIYSSVGVVTCLRMDDFSSILSTDKVNVSLHGLDQWFPNGVSRHPGVSEGTTRCVAKLKKIFKLRLMVIINNWTNDLSN